MSTDVRVAAGKLHMAFEKLSFASRHFISLVSDDAVAVQRAMDTEAMATDRFTQLYYDMLALADTTTSKATHQAAHQASAAAAGGSIEP